MTFKNEETETATGRRYVEWLAGLEASLQQLQYADTVSRQLQHDVQHLSTQNNIAQLRNRILLHKNLLSQLTGEVVAAQNSYAQLADKNEITMGRLIADNRLREKVRKAEQAVFLIKYQVNQLLNKAS